MTTLTTEQRQEIVRELETNLLNNLKKAGIEFTQSAIIELHTKGFTVFIENNRFSSSVEITKNRTSVIGGIKEGTISFANSGAFTPTSEEFEGALFKTVLAASLAMNWEKVMELTTAACNELEAKL